MSVSVLFKQVRKWKSVVTTIQLATTPCVLHSPRVHSSLTNQVEGNGIAKEICQQIPPGYPGC